MLPTDSLRALTENLEVVVPWSKVNLLIVPGCRKAKDLRSKDRHPGRVWCVCEVLDLLLTKVTPDDATAVAQAKLLFAGGVTRVTRGQ